MAEIATGVEPVANALLEGLDVGEATIAFAFPDHFIIVTHFEVATVTWHQCDLVEVLTESRQQFLSIPASAQKPLALRAIVDTDSCHALTSIHSAMAHHSKEELKMAPRDVSQTHLFERRGQPHPLLVALAAAASAQCLSEAEQ